MRIRQRVGRNIITSIICMNIVLIYHICDVIKRMRKYAWSDVLRSSIRFTYSSVARHIGPCICHNSQAYTWNDVIPYKGRMICVVLCLLLLYVTGPYICSSYTASVDTMVSEYTGWLMTYGHYCSKWLPRSLWPKRPIQICVRFWTVTELWPLET
jgi:hypothetical protein